jgi:hypothetical protein
MWQGRPWQHSVQQTSRREPVPLIDPLGPQGPSPREHPGSPSCSRRPLSRDLDAVRDSLDRAQNDQVGPLGRIVCVRERRVVGVYCTGHPVDERINLVSIATRRGGRCAGAGRQGDRQRLNSDETADRISTHDALLVLGVDVTDVVAAVSAPRLSDIRDFSRDHAKDCNR